MIKSTSKTATNPPTSAGTTISKSRPEDTKIPFNTFFSNSPLEISLAVRSHLVLEKHPLASETSPAFNIC